MRRSAERAGSGPADSGITGGGTRDISIRAGRSPNTDAAFTLIELAVVLLLIGLIAGAVLVGRDLIRQAQVRGQINQLSRYDIAVNTFVLRHRALPGDLAAVQAQALGLVDRAGTAGRGDGNGTLEACEAFDPLSGNVPLGCEVLLFWSDLARLRLIEGHFPGAVDDYLPVNATFEDTLDYFPPAALASQGTVVPVRCMRSGTHLRIIRIVGLTYSPVIRAVDANMIDVRLDDGHPLRGKVAVKGIGPTLEEEYFCHPTVIQNPNGCVFQNRYNVAPDSQSCHLLVRLSAGG